MIRYHVVIETRRDIDLPEELAQPLRSGEPYWYWLGGRPSLDLVNTLRERWRRNVETLVTPGDLAAWLVQAGVMEARGRVTGAVLAQARDLREAIDACVTATLGAQPVSPGVVTAIDDLMVFAGARPQLSVEGGVVVLGERAPADSPRRALGTIALDAARMLGTPEQRVRIRICEAATCSARFFDRSPAGARRWCSMRTCGNLAKARRHRERARERA